MKTQVRSRWRRAILVCGKCEKKLKGGFGPHGRLTLSRALAGRDGAGRGRKAELGIVATRCLKVCPRGAVTVVDAERPRDWLIVAAGTALAEVEAALGLVDQPAAA